MEYNYLKCYGTNGLLKDPLVLLKCPHNRKFNFDYIYDEFKKSGFKQNKL